MHFKFVSFYGPVMPDVHDEKKECCYDKRDPPALIDLEEDCREVGAFDDEREGSEYED